MFSRHIRALSLATVAFTTNCGETSSTPPVDAASTTVSLRPASSHETPTHFVVAAPIAVTVDATTRKQKIDGFGGFQGGNFGINGDDRSDFAHRIVDLPDTPTMPYRTQVLDSLFSDWNGLGLTILRNRIPPEMEDSPGHWNNTDHGKCYLGDGLTSTGVSCDTFTPCPSGQTCQNPQVWMMKQAVKRGPVKLFSSPWSPPAWMKSNHNTSGGFLSLSHFQDYANFLSHYANEYAAANGLNFYAISMQNEPDTPGLGACGLDAAHSWDTCAWPDDTIASFLKILATTFATNHVTTKVVAPEAGRWNSVESSAPWDPLSVSCPGPSTTPFMESTCADPVALARVDIVAGHTYSGSTVTLPFTCANNAGKSVWQTETSQLGPNEDCPGMSNLWDVNGSLEWMKQIHDGITSARISAWLFFGLFGGEQGNNCTGSMITLQTAPNNGIALSPFYYMFGNIAKYVRPGFTVIGTSGTNDPLLSVSAYQDTTTRQVVIVAINQSATSRTVTFTNSGWSYPGVATSYTTSAQTISQQFTGLVQARNVSLANTVIPAKSVVTYVTTTPADILWFNGTTNSPTLWLMNSLAGPTSVPVTSNAAEWQIQTTGDFDGDGTSDILWRSTISGQPVIGFMNRATVPASAWLASIPTSSWKVMGTGDFDGDGKSDILWRNFTTGQNQIWLMSGGTTKSSGTFLPVGNDWQINGVGDFDGDGKSDILWRNVTSGQPVIWFMNGTSVIGNGVWLAIVPGNDWQINGVGDFNHDGKADILWRNTNGSVVTWLMNGYNIGNQPQAGTLTSDWLIQGVGDYNSDGTSDVVLRNTNGTVKFWLMQNGVVWGASTSATVLGSAWQIKATGNFDQ